MRYKSDIDIAWDALKDGAEPRLHIFLATSPIHMKYKLNKTPEQVIELQLTWLHMLQQRFPACSMVSRRCCTNGIAIFLSNY